jgi:hypothetical protein
MFSFYSSARRIASLFPLIDGVTQYRVVTAVAPDFTGCGKTLPSCHSEPFAVILRAAKDLALLRVDSARNLALSIFKVLRDSSSSANKNGGLLGMTGQRGFSAACFARHVPPLLPRLLAQGRL